MGRKKLKQEKAERKKSKCTVRKWVVYDFVNWKKIMMATGWKCAKMIDIRDYYQHI